MSEHASLFPLKIDIVKNPHKVSNTIPNQFNLPNINMMIQRAEVNFV